MVYFTMAPLDFEDRPGIGRVYSAQSHLFVDTHGTEVELSAIAQVRTYFRDGVTGGEIDRLDPVCLQSNSVKELRRIAVPANIANYRQRGPHNLAALRVELLSDDGGLIAVQNFAVDNDAFDPVSAVVFN